MNTRVFTLCVVIIVALLVVGCAKSRVVDPAEDLCARVFLSESQSVVEGVALRIPTAGIGRGSWLIRQADGAEIKILHELKTIDAFGVFPCGVLEQEGP